MDDDELIAAVGEGDSAALRALFDRHAPWLSARLARLVPAPAVEDVLQETFVGVWQAAGRYRSQGRPGGWLWGIAVRQGALWLRRNGGAAEQVWPDVEPAGTEDVVAAALARVELARAVETLGPAGGMRRELWRLLFVEDRPEAEVARRLGVSRGTVKSRAHRLRQVLRAALGREGM